MKKIDEPEIRNRNLLFLFLTLILLTGFLNFIEFFVILDEDVIYTHFSSEVSNEKINKFITFRKDFWWVSFIFIVVKYLIKLICLAAIFLGYFVFENIEIKFKNLFNDLIKLEFIVLSSQIIKVTWFLINNDYTYDDVKYFDYFSLNYFLGKLNVTTPYYLNYLLKTLDVFQVLYIMVFSYMLTIYTKRNFFSMIKIVALIYFTVLFIWIMFITYLSI